MASSGSKVVILSTLPSELIYPHKKTVMLSHTKAVGLNLKRKLSQSRWIQTNFLKLNLKCDVLFFGFISGECLKA